MKFKISFRTADYEVISYVGWDGTGMIHRWILKNPPNKYPYIYLHATRDARQSLITFVFGVETKQGRKSHDNKQKILQKIKGRQNWKIGYMSRTCKEINWKFDNI